MDLATFVAESVRQIIDGVRTAQTDAAKVGAVVSPSSIYSNSNGNGFYTDNQSVLGPPRTVHVVEIDVAVTATEASQSKGGAGIMVAALGIGVSGKSDSTQQATSRIKFSVPIMFPEAPQPMGWKPEHPSEPFQVLTGHDPSPTGFGL